MLTNMYLVTELSTIGTVMTVTVNVLILNQIKQSIDSNNIHTQCI